MRWILLACVIGLAFAAKPPDVEVLDIHLKRENDLILVDVTLKNVTAKPIKSLTLILKFYSPGKQVLSTQRLAVDDPLLGPNTEAEIHAQLNAPPKSVYAELSVTDASSKPMTASNAGPFVIEE